MKELSTLLLVAGLISACSHVSSVPQFENSTQRNPTSENSDFYWKENLCIQRKTDGVVLVPYEEAYNCGKPSESEWSVVEAYNRVPYAGNEAIVEPNWTKSETNLLAELFKMKQVRHSFTSKGMAPYPKYRHVAEKTLSLKGTTGDGKPCAFILRKAAYADGARDLSRAEVRYSMQINAAPKQNEQFEPDKFTNNFAQCDHRWTAGRPIKEETESSGLRKLDSQANRFTAYSGWLDPYAPFTSPFVESQVEKTNDGRLIVSCNLRVRQVVPYQAPSSNFQHDNQTQMPAPAYVEKYVKHKVEGCIVNLD